jgi:hypothetical protein
VESVIVCLECAVTLAPVQEIPNKLTDKEHGYCRSDMDQRLLKKSEILPSLNQYIGLYVKF